MTKSLRVRRNFFIGLMLLSLVFGTWLSYGYKDVPDNWVIGISGIAGLLTGLTGLWGLTSGRLVNAERGRKALNQILLISIPLGLLAMAGVKFWIIQRSTRCQVSAFAGLCFSATPVAVFRFSRRVK